ncbi:MAG: methionyl-tRNA formyltransferase [Gammaproteobacteria bacterium]|nr:methionyl-tRNA formyltransferase [Gammaproteobacteria bacterium]
MQHHAGRIGAIMSNPRRHRAHPVFLVATGPPAWTDIVWQEMQRLPGTWCRVTSTPGLRGWLADHGGPRYIFFIHWSERVPSDIVRTCECVNFHMTALPYGRGGSPLQHLILSGHRYTLLTAHRMVEDLDTGPIYCQHSLTLEGRAEEIYRRAMWVIAGQIRHIIADQPAPRPQEGTVVVWPRRTPQDSDIRTKPPGVCLYDFIRMLDAPGYPAAYVEQDGTRYEFTHARKQGDGTLIAQCRCSPIGRGASLRN